MKGHYNLYYLLLEDKEKHPLPAQRSEAIRKNIEKYFKERIVEDASPSHGRNASPTTIYRIPP